MSEERLYSHQQIAEAMGKTRQAIQYRASNGIKGNKKRQPEASWPIAKREESTGWLGNIPSLRRSPNRHSEGLDVWEKAKRAVAAVARVNEMAREEDACYAREMAEAGKSLGEMEQEKANTKRAKRVRRIEEGRRKFGQLPKG
ncbi:hypothetical protein [Candidatus Vondammii sp. HM_W22]|uniref:hypothetical protein n=1 Tax=Candidatus Vondammii sp. HM_W22 TaxID=2687299 RepID=UPI001F13D25A|nr:hypothetical protein [Candidatus Vondammii sp. HM_W22]